MGFDKASADFRGWWRRFHRTLKMVGRRILLLEDRLLDLAGPISRPQIGYIGHASNDNPTRIDAFHARFRDCAGTRVLLYLDAEAGIGADTFWRASTFFMWVGAQPQRCWRIGATLVLQVRSWRPAGAWPVSWCV